MTLLEMLNERHQGKYDYFYLPMDLKVINLEINLIRLNAMLDMPLSILSILFIFSTFSWSSRVGNGKILPVIVRV